MKKKILLMLTLLAGVMTANAADGVTVSQASVKKGSTGTIAIDLTNAEHKFKAFQMVVTLPEGLSFKQIPIYDNDEVTIKYYGCEVTKSDRLVNHAVSSKIDGQTCSFACFDGEFNRNIAGESGTIFTMHIEADETVNIGDKLDALISGITFTVSVSEEIAFDNCSFKISVVENREILDEESTELPANATGVNVKVKRAIKANEWSTICLPFAMDATQLKAAFGSDVLFKEFKDYEETYDETETNVVKIQVNFVDAAALEANHPYMIKVSSDVAEFNVDGVDIAANEEDAIVEYDNGKKGKQRIVFGTFYGTLKAGTAIDADCLFLADNMFWYSAGSTTIKGFRGYFHFADVLADKTATSRIVFNFDGETTGINSVLRDALNDGKVYDLNGRQVEKPGKGVYIVNGKKVVIK